MKNYFLALCILLLVGCTKADVESVSYQKIDSPQFYAEFAEDDTRTFVDEKVRLLWTEGDLLTIFTTTLNQKYQFDGETGDNSGTFTQISAPQFGTGNNISANYAVYPYSSSTKISNDEVITLSLPATQQYAENSFGPNANTMVAVTSGINDYFLPFKNVGGFLRLRLYGEGVTVKSIQLQGNNSEKIAGKATVVAKYGKSPELEMSDDATEIITLDCGDGVELGATVDNATDFWIVVPPTTFTEGFTITITDTEGLSMTKSTTKEYVVERNVLKSMSAFEVEEAELSIPYNQIWYTSSDGEIVTPLITSGFGANIVSNVYENGKGVILFTDDINRIPSMAFINKSNLTNITIPNSVINIDGSAFKGCSNLTNITIPNSVMSIESGAFSGCNNLTSFYGKFASNDNRCLIINGKLCAFAPAGLTEYTIPNNVTNVGEFAFATCNELSHIIIPESVVIIGADAFFLTGLTNVTLPDSIIQIEREAFYGCNSLVGITLSSNLLSIESGAFKSCGSLQTIDIPNSVTHIGDSAFSQCGSLKSFSGKYASSDGRCLIIEGMLNSFAPKGLTEYAIPNEVTSIGDNVFFGCCHLEEISIPNSIVDIGMQAFYGCSKLTYFIIPDGVNTIGRGAFNSCTNLISISIPNSVINIGESAFHSCSSLQTVILSENITTIKSGTFMQCYALRNITIPHNVTEVGQQAFRYCKTLTDITIPENVATIHNEAFYMCYDLENIYCKPITPPQIGDDLFSTLSNSSIYVPSESVDAYKSADGWKSYATKIVGYDFE